MILQECIGSGKRACTEEATSVSGQGAGMVAKDLGFSCPLPYSCSNLLSVGAPKNIYDRLRKLFAGFKDSACKKIPSPAGTAIGLAGENRKCSIEKQDALLRPFGQVARGGDLAADVAVELLEYVAQRWRELLTGVYRKSKAVRLLWPMIGVLSKNDYTYSLGRCLLQCDKDLIAGRIDRTSPLFDSGQSHVISVQGRFVSKLRNVLFSATKAW